METNAIKYKKYYKRIFDFVLEVTLSFEFRKEGVMANSLLVDLVFCTARRAMELH